MDVESLKANGVFEVALTALAIPVTAADRERIEAIRGKRVNDKLPYTRPGYRAPEQLQEREAALLDAVQIPCGTLSLSLRTLVAREWS